ncbi:hypothetical protein BRADI_1g56084v3 [Brachypodium distachyon]|uniref:Uncharacterized protein n=1 Tax=Brachypodium distachyon TaxID=15368 RepID=A0A2K2DRQ0_BRADI|nr:hypothetical protein BRADI_1g56084v3 [Brachypodium distachyon]
MEEEGSEEAARIADGTSSSLAPHSSPLNVLDDVGVAVPVHSSAPPRPRPHPAPLPPPSSSPHGALSLTDLVATTDISPRSRMEETGRISDETSSLAPDKELMMAEPQVPNPTPVTSPALPRRLPPPPPPPSSTHGPHGGTESQPGLYSGVRHRPVRHHVNDDRASINGLTWLSIQEEEELKQREAKLNQIEKELGNYIREAIKSRRELEIKRTEDIIELNQRKEQLDQQEHKFQVEKEKDRLLNTEKLLDERARALRRPLIEHVRNKEENKHDNNVWDKRQNLMAIALVCGLSVLISVQPQLPPDYLSWIVGVFAGLWVLATIAFQEGLFGVYSFQKTFSRHVSRMIFISFCIFVICVFYILSGPLAPVSLSCATSSSPPPPPAPAPSPSFKLDGRVGWYIGLGILAVIGHIFSWCLEVTKTPRPFEI